MKFLTPDETQPNDRAVSRNSSIDQFNEFPLAVIIGGVVTPIAFDVIDYIDCECVHTHKAIYANDDFVGYVYPVDHCTYITDTYAVVDQDGTRLEQLPPYFGEGFYERTTTNPTLVNFDNASLGEHNVDRRTVGLHYVKAKTTLPAEN